MAIIRSPARVSGWSTRPSTASPRPSSVAVRTTTARPATKSREPGSHHRTRSMAGTFRRTIRGAPSTSAPAAATHPGSVSRGELATSPASVAASTARANHGVGSTGTGPVGRPGLDRSPAKHSRVPTYSTISTTSRGSTINAANRANESPVASSASRLVRLETGSSSDAELARCAVACRCGRAETPTRTAAATTTGVKSTTVASRLRTVVIAVPTTSTQPSSERGLEPAARESTAPAQRRVPPSRKVGQEQAPPPGSRESGRAPRSRPVRCRSTGGPRRTTRRRGRRRRPR